MTDQQAQALLTFFQFAFLNQVLAEQAAQEAYQRLEQVSRARPEASFDVLFIQITHQIYERYHVTSLKGKISPLQSALTTQARDIDLSPWRDYFKSASPDELIVVVWALILKLPLAAIAQGLDLSSGTLQHRLSRAVRKLSSKLENAPTPQVRRPWS